MLITVLRSFSIKPFYEIELGMKIIFSFSTFEVMLEKIITFSFLFFANNYSRKYLLGMYRMERSNFKYDYKMGIIIRNIAMLNTLLLIFENILRKR